MSALIGSNYHDNDIVGIAVSDLLAAFVSFHHTLIVTVMYLFNCCSLINDSTIISTSSRSSS